MTITAFLNQLQEHPKSINFQDTIQVIEGNYNFTPTAFQNGNQYNKVGENNGSCKIFAFAKLQNLSKDATLACFGAYYFEDVLQNPVGTDHQNIRNFMQTGWDGINFEGEALVLNH
ncbi:DNA-binding IscR family transcriptional regulator [Flavobacterium arsenatis]|uniref:DNA-binding IscR family transcriptional regulator n=1 Tax=Flavobacterium arsenatis TaxID=1484332 RepID=A0ABU1TRY8_9FLAO|nr:HopJ type III effector protein [Flavobacterium arsenatis]MDR6968641.1 DNA-binding IscR family transcriptional regulator [Flavobacterium arsenatis]